jgi:thioredoxin reductase (NADPH)
MYDVAVIGTGPAGLSAVLTLRALQKNFVWFGSRALSEKIYKAEKIQNYAGLSSVTGKQMQRAFLEQIDALGIEVTEKTVTSVYAMGSHFIVACDKEFFEAKSVILATGVESVKPLRGEEEFLGRGVSYCATCDGFLYKDKTLAIVCTSKAYEHEIEYLAGIAKKVYLAPVYKDMGVFADNVEIVKGMPLAIEGGKRVEKIVYKDKEIAVDGVFLLKTAIAPSALVPGLITEGGSVVVDRQGKTNLAGCFACGDCTGRPYQYAKAVGEGNVCAHSVVEYLKTKS